MKLRWLVMSQFVVMPLTQRLQLLHMVDAWHWKMASSSLENFIKHSSQKKVKFTKCLNMNKFMKHPRTNTLTRKATMIRASMNADTSIKCFFQDWFSIPRHVHMGNYMEDVLFDVRKLPIVEP